VRIALTRSSGADLGQVTGGSRTYQVDGVLVFRIGRQDQHRQGRQSLSDQLQHVDAIPIRHGNVEHEHVELAVAQLRHHFVAAASFARHLDVRLLGNELAQTCAHDLVIVGDQDANHLCLHGEGWPGFGWTGRLFAL
jgi:hypothetical protein